MAEQHLLTGRQARRIGAAITGLESPGVERVAIAVPSMPFSLAVPLADVPRGGSADFRWLTGQLDDLQTDGDRDKFVAWNLVSRLTIRAGDTCWMSRVVVPGSDASGWLAFRVDTAVRRPLVTVCDALVNNDLYTAATIRIEGVTAGTNNQEIADLLNRSHYLTYRPGTRQFDWVIGSAPDGSGPRSLWTPCKRGVRYDHLENPAFSEPGLEQWVRFYLHAINVLDTTYYLELIISVANQLSAFVFPGLYLFRTSTSGTPLDDDANHVFTLQQVMLGPESVSFDAATVTYVAP